MKLQSLFPLVFQVILLVNGQCPNQVFPGIGNNLQRTGGTNYTYAIIPILKSKVMQVIGNKKLLDLPSDDFPTGFPAGSTQFDYHPIWCNIGYQNDIRQIFLSINWLLQAACAVPYVDCTGNGGACNYPLFNALGGKNGQLNPALVPALVATLFGTPTIVGEFDPPNAAFKEPTPGQYSSVVQNAFLLGTTNTFSGPSFLGKLMDVQWQIPPPGQAAKYSLRAWKHIINLPPFLPYYGTCARNNYYFNSPFNQNFNRIGTVTLYGQATVFKNPLSGGLFSPLSPVIAEPTGTTFSGVEILQSMCGQWISREIAEDCAVAIMNNDKSSWET